jgi:hypothetical protein
MVFVTGAAALLRSLHPDWRGPQLREELIHSAAKSEDLDGYVKRLGISKGKVISGFLRAFPKKAGHKGARRGSLDGFSAFYG